MNDEQFEAVCTELNRLADLVAAGTPEQIRNFAEVGWWDAFDTLRRVYNDWLMDAAA